MGLLTARYCVLVQIMWGFSRLGNDIRQQRRGNMYLCIVDTLRKYGTGSQSYLLLPSRRSKTFKIYFRHSPYLSLHDYRNRSCKLAAPVIQRITGTYYGWTSRYRKTSPINSVNIAKHFLRPCARLWLSSSSAKRI